MKDTRFQDYLPVLKYMTKSQKRTYAKYIMNAVVAWLRLLVLWLFIVVVGIAMYVF